MRNKFTILCTSIFLLHNTFIDAQCFKKVSTVWDTNIALSEDGTIWEWGSNNSGQLGLGVSNFQDRNTPFQLTTSNDWKNVISYYRTTMAQKNDGTLWAWGSGSNGIFGNGSSGITNYIYVPTQVNTVPYDKIFKGFETSFAIKSDGTLWGWGYNSDGQVGVGSSPFNVLVPTQVGADTNWQHISGSLYHTVAIKTDGTLWSWGANGGGTLGNGTTISTSLPVQIGTGNTWKDISSSSHTLALKTDGTLWGWGGNSYGQVGDGTTVDKIIPTQIGTDNDWRQARTSNESSFAIKNDGSLWAWGRNEGRLGDGTMQQKLVPTRVGNSYEWQDIECGGSHCIARKQDNSIWTWGYNNRGQLGNGTFSNNFIPTMIKGPCSLLGTETAITSFQHLKIFPNPVSEYLNFSKEIKNIKIYDINGILVKDVQNINNNKINLSSLDTGVYVIEALTSDEKIFKEKFIKR
ncbi:T9SS type A sorting domain-containing protein [Chryseobacterium fluminis]|uniref:T9SS type A sorting domain-containing protein n=1 Tax=Chryseobacterium fluminis TaxID=2983606 RepID=UPI00224DB46E|nr:T9SS type A sorting domain-containing protein [Chryseobacterium sp. MMS21-Ot14]UZT99055.1 T9SS type A sorting domain-containing protein [Chryseobacterium sp. MMS21-Ot14]